MSLNICSYTLKKGKNKGQVCGLKCLNNTQLCKKHSIDEDTINENKEENKNIIKSKEPKEKKVKEPKEPKEPKEKKVKEPKEKKVKEPKEPNQTGIKVNIFERKKIQAKRNEHNNYVLENNLVVHPVNKNIIGRQQDEKIIELSIEDIEFCKENGFRYIEPSVMYFMDSENEKKEVELQKLMMKTSKNNNEEDELEDSDELEEDELEDSDNENNGEN